MKSKIYRMLLNLFPPYRTPGIRVNRLSKDFREAEVSLKPTWRSKNMFGTIFGGNLYSMVDPFYVLMFFENLEKNYIIWDKEAHIRFVSPGRKPVKAKFSITERDLDVIREHTAGGEVFTPTYMVDILDEDGRKVAEVEKMLYFKKKAA